MKPTILVVDDDTSNLASLVKIFDRLGLRALPATSGQEALETMRSTPVTVILTDLMMPKMSGVDLLKNIKSIAPDTEVVMMTAYGTIERAVEAMREGAYDFVTKPFRRAEIERVITRALEKQSLLAENKALRAELADARKAPAYTGGIIGTAPTFPQRNTISNNHMRNVVRLSRWFALSASLSRKASLLQTRSASTESRRAATSRPLARTTC